MTGKAVATIVGGKVVYEDPTLSCTLVCCIAVSYVAWAQNPTAIVDRVSNQSATSEAAEQFVERITTALCGRSSPSPKSPRLRSRKRNAPGLSRRC